MRFVPRVRLFGPVLPYDMVRTARRGRYVLIRCLYAGVLAGVLGMVYLSWYTERGGSELRVTELADFAEQFFFTFLAVQFCAVALLTPAYSGGAIADEKERRTLDYLLATDLRNPELVLGKLTSRLAGLGLIVLTGLPVLSLLQLAGGVDPMLVLLGFAATFVTMLSLAGLSILCSVQVRRARDAVLGTYLGSLLYLTFSGLCWLLLEPEGWATWPSTEAWTSPVTLQDVVEWINAGNPVSAVVRIENQSGSRDLQGLVMEMLVPYVLFHAVLGVACVTGAVWRVRKVALKQVEAPTVKAGRLQAKKRPQVGRRPVLWKEVYVEGRRPMGWPRFLATTALVLLSYVPPVWMAVYIIFFDDRANNTRIWEELAQGMNIWARIVGTIVMCLVLITIAIRAAGSVTGERERQTLDALLTSPLEARDIVNGKWLGSIVGNRAGWIWAGSILALGVLTRGVHLAAVPLVLLAWCAYAAFMAALGLWFSLYCRTTLRALIATMLGVIAFSFGHWLVWMCAMPIALLDLEPAWGNVVAEQIANFQLWALTPPATLGMLTFYGEEFRWSGEHGWGFEWIVLAYCVFGIVLYGAGAALFYALARRRFGRLYWRRPVAASPRSAAPVPVAP